MRCTLIADLPSSFVSALDTAYNAALGDGGLITRKDVPAILRAVGILLPPICGSHVRELLDVVDADGSGNIDMGELLVCAGMLQRERLELSMLASVFSELTGTPAERSAARPKQKRRASMGRVTLSPIQGGSKKQDAEGAPTSAPASALSALGRSLAHDLAHAGHKVAHAAHEVEHGLHLDELAHKVADVAHGVEHGLAHALHLDEHHHSDAARKKKKAHPSQLSPADLAEVLSISMREAEDLVYLADLDRFSRRRLSAPPAPGAAHAEEVFTEEETIDMIEFYRLVTSWT